MDGDGIIRAGGQIRHAKLTENAKQPYILPIKGHATDLVIRCRHKWILYQGRGINLPAIRSACFWILGGGSGVAKRISKCVECGKLPAATGEQKMADLPKNRFKQSQPFTYSAADYFGPWMVKEG